MSRYSFDRMKALQVGDVYYECEMGLNIHIKVTSAPVLDETGEGRERIEWDAINIVNNEAIHYLSTRGYDHYGPYLYDQPQYITIRGGEITYNLMGEEKANG